MGDWGRRVAIYCGALKEVGKVSCDDRFYDGDDGTFWGGFWEPVGGVRWVEFAPEVGRMRGRGGLY